MSKITLSIEVQDLNSFQQALGFTLSEGVTQTPYKIIGDYMSWGTYPKEFFLEFFGKCADDDIAIQFEAPSTFCTWGFMQRFLDMKTQFDIFVTSSMGHLALRYEDNDDGEFVRRVLDFDPSRAFRNKDDFANTFVIKSFRYDTVESLNEVYKNWIKDENFSIRKLEGDFDEFIIPQHGAWHFRKECEDWLDLPRMS